MKIALTGASGLVGGWIAQAAREAGHQVIALSRPAWQLGDAPDLTGFDALIHAAFQHVPGRYRGGEGDDPQAFIRANLDGSLALFRAARDGGVRRAIFMSSRAVHDGYPPGMVLPDELSPKPTTLYGEVKARVEAALSDMAGPEFRTASLRPTGVYGPGPVQKWTGLITGFLAGTTPPPAIATEVHGADLGAAAMLVLDDSDMGSSYNVSDLVLDRRDLLAAVARLTGCRTPLPERADASDLKRLNCMRLNLLGWRPGGGEILLASLPEILRHVRP